VIPLRAVGHPRLHCLRWSPYDAKGSAILSYAHLESHALSLENIPWPHDEKEAEYALIARKLKSRTPSEASLVSSKPSVGRAFLGKRVSREVV